MAFDLDHIFTHHAPDTAKAEKYQAIRDAAKAFAAVVIANTPRGDDLDEAVRKIREAVMTANAAIALDGRLFEFTPPVFPKFSADGATAD